MVKQFIRNIKYLFLRTEHIRFLEEENTALQRVLVEAIDLVSDYKRAIQEMQRMVALLHSASVEQMAQDFTEFEMLEGLDEEDNNEEKGKSLYHRSMLKKTTIH